MRLFVGIGLPPGVRDALGDAVDGLRGGHAPVSWVPRENLHITLKFLGEHPPAKLPALEGALACAAAAIPPFDLVAEGGGAFPGTRNPRVFWAGFREPLELAGELQQNMENALSGAGFPREDRPFHPHITVGRARGALPPAWGERFVRTFAGRGFGVVPVASFRLFESRLSPAGASYAVVRDFPLRGSPRDEEKKNRRNGT
jgi:2'-5' RNA ligase